MRVLKNQSGVGLTILVAIIAILGLVLMGSVRSFENMSRQTQLRIDQTKAHYLAQAGVMTAVWNWYISNTATEASRRWSPINTTVTGNNLFKVGMDSNAAYLQSNYAYFTSKSPTAITHVKNVVSLPSKAAGTTTIALTVPAAGVARDNFLVIYVAMDGGGGVFLTPPAIDTQGNTYYLAADKVPGAPDNNTLVRTALIYGEVKTALVNPNTITVRWTNNVTAKAVTISEFSGVSTWDPPVVNSGIGTVSPVSTGNVTTNIANSVLVSAVGLEGPSGDVFTKDVDYLWTPPTRTSTGNVACVSPANCADITLNPQYRIIAATETNDANGVLSAARDWTAVLANFHDTMNWYTSSGNRRLRTWRIRNIHTASSITLDKIKVTWTPTNAAVLNDIRLNNTSVWSGSASSGTTIDVANTALASGFTWGGENTYLQWDVSPPDPIKVTCQFIFNVVAPATTADSDANTSEIVMWNGAQSGGGLPGQRSFTVVSTGQVNQTVGGNFKVLKTVKATVSGAPGISAMEITDWDEGDKNIP